MNEAVKSLKELCGDQPALFVVDWSRASDNCKKCYNMRKLDGDDREFQIFNHIGNIYKGHNRKNGYVQNYEVPLQPNRNVENWITNPDGKDMYTRTDLVHGLSHDVVVCFQEDSPNIFEHNVCMRSRAILIVVYIPEKAYEMLCFCKLRSEKSSAQTGTAEVDSLPSLVRIGANGQPIYGNGDSEAKKWTKKAKKKSKKRF